MRCFIVSAPLDMIPQTRLLDLLDALQNGDNLHTHKWEALKLVCSSVTLWKVKINNNKQRTENINNNLNLISSYFRLKI